jgi:hypothetical protein
MLSIFAPALERGAQQCTERVAQELSGNAWQSLHHQVIARALPGGKTELLLVEGVKADSVECGKKGIESAKVHVQAKSLEDGRRHTGKLFFKAPKAGWINKMLGRKKNPLELRNLKHTACRPSDALNRLSPEQLRHVPQYWLDMLPREEFYLMNQETLAALKLPPRSKAAGGISSEFRDHVMLKKAGLDYETLANHFEIPKITEGPAFEQAKALEGKEFVGGNLAMNPQTQIALKVHSLQHNIGRKPVTHTIAGREIRSEEPYLDPKSAFINMETLGTNNRGTISAGPYTGKDLIYSEGGAGIIQSHGVLVEKGNLAEGGRLWSMPHGETPPLTDNAVFVNKHGHIMDPNGQKTGMKILPNGEVVPATLSTPGLDPAGFTPGLMKNLWESGSRKAPIPGIDY